jgi:predicted ATPase
MLTKIEIENFRFIEKMELPLTNMNVIVGNNDVDAPVLFKAFLIGKLVASGTWKEYVQKIGWKSLLPIDRKDKDVETKIAYTADFEKDIAEYVVTLSEKNDSAKATIAITNKKTGIRRMFDLDQNTGMTSREKQIKNTFLSNIQSWWIQGQPLENSSNPLYVAEDGSNLGKVLKHLQTKYPENYNAIIPYMKMRTNSQLKELLPSDEQLRWTEKGSNFVYDEKMMSNGIKRYLMLVTLMNLPIMPSLVILENPETSLHPYNIRTIGATIRSVPRNESFSFSQILLSTQSERLLNAFDPNDIIIATNERQHSYFERLDMEAIEPYLLSSIKGPFETLAQLWLDGKMERECIHGPRERSEKWRTEQKEKKNKDRDKDSSR